MNDKTFTHHLHFVRSGEPGTQAQLAFECTRKPKHGECLAALKAAVTMFVRDSKEAQEWYIDQTYEDANIGDVLTYGYLSSLKWDHAPWILRVSEVPASDEPSVAYDTHLCDWDPDFEENV